MNTAEHIADKITCDGVRLDFQIETDARGKFGAFYGPDHRSLTMVRLPVAAAIILSHEVCILTAAEMSSAIKRAAKAGRDGADVRTAIHAPAMKQRAERLEIAKRPHGWSVDDAGYIHFADK